MANLKVEVEVSKEAYELGQGLVKMAKAVKDALSDGWQIGSDVPVLVAAAVAHLGEAVNGVDQLDDEAKADLGAFSKALGLSAADMAGMFMSKSE